MRKANKKLIRALFGSRPERVLSGVIVKASPILQPCEFREVFRECALNNDRVARIARRSIECEFMNRIPVVEIDEKTSRAGKKGGRKS